MTAIQMLQLHSNTWNYLTVGKTKIMSTGLFKNVINKMILVWFDFMAYQPLKVI